MLDKPKTLYLLWYRALMSGEYERAQHGVLYDGFGYSALGVANLICFGAIYAPIDEPENGESETIYADETGMVSRLDPIRATALNLSKCPTPRDWTTFQHAASRYYKPGKPQGITSREEMIAFLDNVGYNFRDIALYISLTGWEEDN